MAEYIQSQKYQSEHLENDGFVTGKLRYKASPFMEKKAVEGWRGLLAISNQPREEKNSLSANPIR